MKDGSKLKGLGIALAVIIVLIAGTRIISSFSGSKTTIKSYVYDEAGVLSDATEKYIVSVDASLERQCGAQIVVACLKTTGDTDIADYATELFNKLKIGDSKKNNGVLVLLSIEEDAYWVLQGKGIESVLSSGIIKLMLNEHLEPSFAIKDYDSGVKELFDALIDHFEAMYSITVNANASNGSGNASHSNPMDEEQSGGLFSSIAALAGRVAGLIGKILAFAAVAIVVIVVLVIIAAFAGRRDSRTETRTAGVRINPVRTDFGHGRTVSMNSRNRTGPGNSRSSPEGFTHASGGLSRPAGGRSSGGSTGQGFSGGGGFSRGGGSGRR